MTETTTSAEKTVWAAGPVFKGAFAGAAAGAVANVLLYFIAGAAGVSMTGKFDPALPASALPIAPVAIASLVPAIPASLVALGVGRFAKDPAKVYTVIAAVFCLLSLGGPANLAESSLGLKLVLDLMHVFSGVGITLGILRANKR
jgi:hypothetical protein